MDRAYRAQLEIQRKNAEELVAQYEREWADFSGSPAAVLEGMTRMETLNWIRAGLREAVTTLEALNNQLAEDTPQETIQ